MLSRHSSASSTADTIGGGDAAAVLADAQYAQSMRDSVDFGRDTHGPHGHDSAMQFPIDMEGEVRESEAAADRAEEPEEEDNEFVRHSEADRSSLDSTAAGVLQRVRRSSSSGSNHRRSPRSTTGGVGKSYNDSVASSMLTDITSINEMRPELRLMIERSGSIISEGPMSPAAKNEAYATLTEKNVNLHILRTVATEAAIGGKQPSAFSRQLGSRRKSSPAKEAQQPVVVLSECRVLVVDGEFILFLLWWAVNSSCCKLYWHFTTKMNFYHFVYLRLFHLDAPSNRKLLTMLLRRAGFIDVDSVEDGQQAVDYCQAVVYNAEGKSGGVDPSASALTMTTAPAATVQQPPSIIFMDNTMPRMVSVLLIVR